MRNIFGFDVAVDARQRQGGGEVQLLDLSVALGAENGRQEEFAVQTRHVVQVLGLSSSLFSTGRC